MINIKGSYFEQFEKLLTKLEPENKHIVIMVDEFPDAIENIRYHHGEQASRAFLQKNRELRQKAPPLIHFMYTGSIGLPLVVKKIMSLNVISDLNVIEVPPLSYEQAEQMVIKLFESYNITYEPAIIPHLLNELEWWIPYHIQLAIQELIDVHDAYGFLGKEAVDKAFTQLLHTRHDSSFYHYFSRLEQSFQDENEYQFSLTLLHQLAQKGTLTISEMEAIANQHNLNSPDTIVIDSLIFDGYISFNQHKKRYSFTSLLLKKWWNKKNL